MSSLNIHLCDEPVLIISWIMIIIKSVDLANSYILSTNQAHRYYQVVKLIILLTLFCFLNSKFGYILFWAGFSSGLYFNCEKSLFY